MTSQRQTSHPQVVINNRQGVVNYTGYQLRVRGSNLLMIGGGAGPKFLHLDQARASRAQRLTELYHGIILWDYITEWHYGIIVRDNIMELYYRIMLRGDIT